MNRGSLLKLLPNLTNVVECPIIINANLEKLLKEKFCHILQSDLSIQVVSKYLSYTCKIVISYFYFHFFLVY